MLSDDDPKVESIAALIPLLSDTAGKTVWFRGHAVANWALQPGLIREKKIAAEMLLVKRFKQNAMPYLRMSPGGEWDWLFLMQHYGSPTRLLDWTESPLAALYFAVEQKHDGIDGKYDTSDGALWCLLPIELNTKAGVKLPYFADIPCFGSDEELDGFLPSKVCNGRSPTVRPMAGLAVRDSARIQAQQGVFTISHPESESIDALAVKDQIAWRYIIPAAAKENIRKELGLLRVNRLALFPELSSVAAASLEFMA